MKVGDALCGNQPGVGAAEQHAPVSTVSPSSEGTKLIRPQVRLCSCETDALHCTGLLAD
jgi:hypothetical protein